MNTLPLARRIRSALATFAPLLDAETAATLREELKWLASELGDAYLEVKAAGRL